MFFQDRYLHPIRSDFRSYATDCGLAELRRRQQLHLQCVFTTTMYLSKSPEPKSSLPGIKTDHIGRLTEPRFVHRGRATGANTQSSALEFVQGSHLWDQTSNPNTQLLKVSLPNKSKQLSGGALLTIFGLSPTSARVRRLSESGQHPLLRCGGRGRLTFRFPYGSSERAERRHTTQSRYFMEMARRHALGSETGCRPNNSATRHFLKAR